MREFPYFTTGYVLRIADLAQHKYHGEAYVGGFMQPALFINPAGARRVVWTWGSWDEFEVLPGRPYSFRHTQTGYQETLRLFSPITPQNQTVVSVFGPNEIVQWNLE